MSLADKELKILELEHELEVLKRDDMDHSYQIKDLQNNLKQLKKDAYDNMSAYDRVYLARKQTRAHIHDYLDFLFPNPVCELEYNKDYELLIAIVLSAQTTDKRVNKVTRVLFSKYKTIEELANADVSDIENIIREIGTYKRKSMYVKEIANYLYKNSIKKIPNDRKVFLELVIKQLTCFWVLFIMRLLLL